MMQGMLAARDICLQSFCFLFVFFWINSNALNKSVSLLTFLGVCFCFWVNTFPSELVSHN